MNQRTNHTTPPPSSQAAAYGYKHVGGLASQGMTPSHTLTEPGYMAYSGSASKTLYVKSSKTDYTYFGARYLDSDLSIWLSVDPLSDKYPSTSPFMYAEGNPVMLIDPNGMNTIRSDAEIMEENMENEMAEVPVEQQRQNIINSYENPVTTLVNDKVKSGEIKTIDDMSKLINNYLKGDKGSYSGQLGAIQEVSAQYDYEESANGWTNQGSINDAELNETWRSYQSLSPYLPIPNESDDPINAASIPVKSIRVEVPGVEVRNPNTGKMEKVTHIVFAVRIVLITST